MNSKLEEAVAALARAMVVMDAAVGGLNAAVTLLNEAVSQATAAQEGASIKPAKAGIVGGEVELRVVRNDGHGNL